MTKAKTAVPSDTRAAGRRVVTAILRAVAIVLVACLAPIAMFLGGCFWLTAGVYCAISVVVSRPKGPFPYEDDARDHT